MLIKIDTSEMKKIPDLLKSIQEKAAKKATQHSMQKAIKAGFTELVQGVRASGAVKLTASELKGGGTHPYFMQRINAWNSTPLSEMRAEIRASEFKISLARFFARKKLVTVSAMRARGGAASKLKLCGAQVRVMGKSYLAGTGFLMQKGGALVILKRQGKGRFPLTKEWGPSMARIIAGTRVQERANQRARDAFALNFKRDFPFYLSQIRTRRAAR